MTKKSRNVVRTMLTSATALLSAFGTGVEAVQVHLSKKTSVYYETECAFGGDLGIFGSNALSSDAKYHVQSQYMDNGIQVAIDEINKMCGIVLNGINYSLSYQVVDDLSSPDMARVMAATQLGVVLNENGTIKRGSSIASKDSTAFYVAPYSSSLCEKVNPVTSVSKKASIAPGCSAQSVYTGNDNVFGVRVPAAALMRPAMTAYSMMSAKSVASVVEGDLASMPFTHAVCSDVNFTAQALDMTFLSETVLKTAEQATDNEIDAMVKTWKAQDADMIVGCTYEVMCQRIIESMIRNDYDPKAMAFTECVGVGSVTESLGKKLKGVAGSSPFPSLASPSAGLVGGITTHQEFAAAYKKLTGETEVSIQAAASYAGVKIMIDAIKAVNSTDGALIAAHLYSKTIPTAFGDFNFDATGQPTNQAVVMQYDDDMKLQVVYPPERKTANIIYPKPKWATLVDSADPSADSGTNQVGTDTVPSTDHTDHTVDAVVTNPIPKQLDYTDAIIGSVVGGLFMLGAMLIGALVIYTYLFRVRQ